MRETRGMSLAARVLSRVAILVVVTVGAALSEADRFREAHGLLDQHDFRWAIALGTLAPVVLGLVVVGVINSERARRSSNMRTAWMVLPGSAGLLVFVSTHGYRRYGPDVPPSISDLSTFAWYVGSDVFLVLGTTAGLSAVLEYYLRNDS